MIPPAGQDSHLLTARQAARRIGVTPQTITFWCRRLGIGICCTVPVPHWMVSPDELRLISQKVRFRKA